MKTKHWQDFLPRGSAEKIKEQLKLSISLRQVQRTIKDGIADPHGILEEAIKMATKEQKRRQRLEDKKTLLMISPLKSK